MVTLPAALRECLATARKQCAHVRVRLSRAAISAKGSQRRELAGKASELAAVERAIGFVLKEKK